MGGLVGGLGGGGVWWGGAGRNVVFYYHTNPHFGLAAPILRHFKVSSAFQIYLLSISVLLLFWKESPLLSHGSCWRSVPFDIRALC